MMVILAKGDAGSNGVSNKMAVATGSKETTGSNGIDGCN
jgi:hypothetical protein